MFKSNANPVETRQKPKNFSHGAAVSNIEFDSLPINGRLVSDTLPLVMNHLRSAVYLIDELGYVAYANSRASRLASGSKAFRIDSAGRLRIQELNLAERLAKFPEQGLQAKSKENQMSSQKFGLIDRTDGNNFLVEIIALDYHSPELPITGMYALIALKVPFSYSFSVHCIADLFGLTISETTILQHIVDGQSVADIAKLRRTSYETTRGQLKSIFSKTDTRSQPELIRLCLTLNSGFI